MSGSDDKTLRLWNAVSGTHLNTLNGHSNSVTSVAFSPDGRQIMSASDDKTLQLWDAATGYNIWIYDTSIPSVQRPHLNWDSRAFITLSALGNGSKTAHLLDRLHTDHLMSILWQQMEPTLL